MTDAQPASRRPEYLGDPTVARVATRPRWIAALVLALIVAAVFAWLGRWQIDNAIRTDPYDSAAYETPRPLSEVAQAGVAVKEDSAGAVVTTSGSIRADDLQIVAPRDNAGERGAWVVGHLVLDTGDTEAGAEHLAVALGWAPSTEAAEVAIGELSQGSLLDGEWSLEGRYMPAEGPSVPDPAQDPSLITAMVPAYLVNLWSGFEGQAFPGYLVLHPSGESAELLDAVALDEIDSVAPEPPEAVSWLNIFYAVEWVVFAGFAIFLWYRLVRDSWEKEHELKLLAAEEYAGSDEGRGSDDASDATHAEPSGSKE